MSVARPAPGSRRDKAADATRWTPPDLLKRDDAPPRPPTAAELAAIEDEARALGFEAGFKEGRDAGFDSAVRETRARAEQLLRADRERLCQLAEAWRDQWPDSVAVLEDALLGLVECVARKVVAAELALRPERIREWLNAALDQMPDEATAVTVTLHPRDALLVLGRPLDAGRSVAWTDRVEVRADASLDPGDLVLEGPATRIDYRVRARIEAALDALWAGHDRDRDPVSRERNDANAGVTAPNRPGPRADASGRPAEQPARSGRDAPAGGNAVGGPDDDAPPDGRGPASSVAGSVGAEGAS